MRVWIFALVLCSVKSVHVEDIGNEIAYVECTRLGACPNANQNSTECEDCIERTFAFDLNGFTCAVSQEQRSCLLNDTDTVGGDMGNAIKLNSSDPVLSSWRECNAICRNTPNCTTWAFQKDTKLCYLKRALLRDLKTIVNLGVMTGHMCTAAALESSCYPVCNNLKDPQRCMECQNLMFRTGSGIRTPPVIRYKQYKSSPDSTGLLQLDGYDIQGYDIPPTLLDIPDFTVCRQKCRAVKGCQFVVYSSSLKQCYLKSSVGPSNVVSAQGLSLGAKYPGTKCGYYILSQMIENNKTLEEAMKYTRESLDHCQHCRPLDTKTEVLMQVPRGTDIFMSTVVTGENGAVRVFQKSSKRVETIRYIGGAKLKSPGYGAQWNTFDKTPGCLYGLGCVYSPRVAGRRLDSNLILRDQLLSAFVSAPPNVNDAVCYSPGLATNPYTNENNQDLLDEAQYEALKFVGKLRMGFRQLFTRAQAYGSCTVSIVDPANLGYSGKFESWKLGPKQRIVLTASHCLNKYDAFESLTEYPKTSVVFNSRSLECGGGITENRQYSPEETTNTESLTEAKVVKLLTRGVGIKKGAGLRKWFWKGLDYAILIIERQQGPPLPDGGLSLPHVQPVGTGAYYGPAFIAGYPFGKPLGISAQQSKASKTRYGCNTYKKLLTRDQYITMSCVGSSGMSGGPVMHPKRDSAAAQVIGLYIGYHEVWKTDMALGINRVLVHNQGLDNPIDLDKLYWQLRRFSDILVLKPCQQNGQTIFPRRLTITKEPASLIARFHETNFPGDTLLPEEGEHMPPTVFKVPPSMLMNYRASDESAHLSQVTEDTRKCCWVRGDVVNPFVDRKPVETCAECIDYYNREAYAPRGVDGSTKYPLIKPLKTCPKTPRPTPPTLPPSTPSPTHKCKTGIGRIFSGVKCGLIGPVIAIFLKFATQAAGITSVVACEELFGSISVGCEVLGGGPEDPLSDVCAGAAIDFSLNCATMIRTAGGLASYFTETSLNRKFNCDPHCSVGPVIVKVVKKLPWWMLIF
mmetsp:Transcript_3301/g.6172  ORF Transcript_3301/g.6172 Transcript_3301/m.6172 type:complete len:1023 (+) Transcript_3301:3182-6250(+)